MRGKRGVTKGPAAVKGRGCRRGNLINSSLINIMTEQKEIKKEIDKWLKGQGYPLEMKVASELRKAGFDVQLSHYYTDPENEAIREIDIIASYPDDRGCLNISFVIECKVSKQKPWLLFSTSHTLEGFNRLFAYCINSDTARGALAQKDVESWIKLPWMKKEGRTAYGVTQAFTSGEDVTFKATTSVLKAAIARQRELSKQRWKPFVFVFPIVIVDGGLFECYLNDKGEVLIESLQDINLFFPWRVGDDIGTCIRICTVDKLSILISEAKSVGQAISLLLKPDVELKFQNDIKKKM